MFGRFTVWKTSDLDEPIKALLDDINTIGPDDPEYSKKVEQLDRLMKIKAAEPRFRVSPDTVFLVLGNLLGILIIVSYEQKHVLVSKALNYIQKMKN